MKVQRASIRESNRCRETTGRSLPSFNSHCRSPRHFSCAVRLIYTDHAHPARVRVVLPDDTTEPLFKVHVITEVACAFKIYFHPDKLGKFSDAKFQSLFRQLQDMRFGVGVH
jgi:hypothetical protein